jgi:dipeptidyl aminopeptidase/acylaminoacyl peptidase
VTAARPDARPPARPGADALPPLDAEALWRLARIGSAALSPDGTQVVASVSTYDRQANRGRSALWRLHTDGRAPRRLSWCGEHDAQPAWSPDGRWIAFVGRRGQQGAKDTRPQLYRIAADGGEAERLSDFDPGVGAFAWAPDGRSLVFVAWVWPALRGIAAQQRQSKTWNERKESGFVTESVSWRHWDHNLPEDREPHLLRLELGTRRIRDLFEGTGLALPRADPGSRHFALHPDGRRIAVVHDPRPDRRSDAELTISELDTRSGGVRALAAEAGWSFVAPAWSPDGQRLACTAAHIGRHHLAPRRLACVDLAAAPKRPRWQRVGDPGWDHEPDAPLRWTPDGQALLFAAEARGRRPLWRCTLADGRIETVVPGGSVQGFDLARDPDDPQGPPRLLTVADSALHPARVHLHRANGRAPERLEHFNDAELARHRLGAVHETEITGALGDPVQLWWVEPVGFAPRRRHPLLHVIHGGPFAASGDSWSWRWNPHVLASRGHVVLLTNYHGSSGFGEAFKQSLVGRKGQLELQDIEAATDWALAQRWADERRVFASGGSYGGFLVAWMNGHVPPGRYRAYVVHAGVFDRVASFAADSYLQRPKDMDARYWENLPKVLAQSPHTFAGRMATPTLITHGVKDYRVPDVNALAYYNTLKARGVPARLLWFPDEHHWVLKPCNSLQWHAEFLDWLHVNDPPPATTAPLRRASRPRPARGRG